MSKPRFNQNIKFTVHSLGNHGEGIGDWLGWTVFVDDALPGEVVDGRVIQKEPSYARAEVTRIVALSPDRVRPPCPIFTQCGGCQIMHLSYEQQLVFKQGRVAKAFGRYDTLKDIDLAPCLPSPQPLGYRNKIQLPVRSSEQGMKIGLYARDSNNLVEVRNCLVHCELGEEIFQTVRALISKYPITAYEPSTGEGMLRFILIKTAVNTEEVLVTLVANSYELATMQTFAEDILTTLPAVKGVVLNHNNSPSNVVLSDSFVCLAGTPYIHEHIGGLKFKVSPASFFQVNPYQAEILYRKALEFADIKPQDHVLDAYCGVGTLALHAAQRAKSVIGIECLPEAIKDAKTNAELNNLHNTNFICGSSENVLPGMTKMDLVFSNPPRKGCDKRVLDALVQMRPRSLVYISCEPETLARDLNLLAGSGYQIDCVQPLDMFPQTTHVETIVKLSYS